MLIVRWNASKQCESVEYFHDSNQRMTGVCVFVHADRYIRMLYMSLLVLNPVSYTKEGISNCFKNSYKNLASTHWAERGNTKSYGQKSSRKF